MKQTNIFFTADLHLNHERIAKIRGFSSAEEMDEVIISKWNKTVGPWDTVYLLGDYFMGSRDKYDSVVSRLKGEKRLVLGNHDRMQISREQKYFQKIAIRDQLSTETPEGKRRIQLDHYPGHVWNASYHGSWLLCGHCHGMLKESLPREWYAGLLLDIGVDIWDLTPVPLEEIIRVMLWKEKKIAEAGGIDLGDYKRKGWPSSWKLSEAQDWSEGNRELE